MNFRITSPLTKLRLSDKVAQFPRYESASALLGDRLYFSAVYDSEGLNPKQAVRAQVTVCSELAPHIKVYAVDHVPVRLPHYPTDFDGDYIGHEPGLYPDVLRPTDTVHLQPGQSGQLYFELNVPKDVAAGTYPITVEILPEGSEEAISATLTVEILPEQIPEQTITYTQWFHYDCLASYYNVEIFSQRHWEIIENFMRTAVKTGINAILTPVFTPPLDTAIGGERPTVQLVDIKVKKGKYSFGFEKLKRFCEMCRRIGVRDLEIAHLFTQWGAEHAPKIMATVDGKYKRIFGWETDAASKEYFDFLHAFLPALIKKLNEYGYEGHYFFHISDEPNKNHLESYQKAKNAVWDLIGDYPVRDALSHYEFYEQGLVKNPIPYTKSAHHFVKHGVPDLWVYYCCSPGASASNRFIAMSANRTRVIGAQMYRAGISGFLHWGYNFYYNQFSRGMINPYLCTDGDFFAPAGDTFSVYPAANGTPLLSLRTALFEQALFDMRAMALAEQKAGREAVIAAIDRCGATDFTHYSLDPKHLLTLREEINKMAVEKA